MRLVVRTVAELVLTAAVILVLFVAYQMWWTSWISGQEQDSLRQQLEQQWDDPALAVPALGGSQAPANGPDATPDPDTTAQPIVGDDATGAPGTVQADRGAAFAMTYIPKLRDKVWGTPVLNGVDATSLARGIGYYPGTAAPGEVGNFALAGHRATHGEPLRDIDRLRVGDIVIVRTREAWFTYSLERSAIVDPSDTWVIHPVPFQSEGQLLGRRITLTTCHPRWGSTHRYVWWGQLVDVRSVQDGPPPAMGSA